MNYYPFHLGDYATHTAHLEPMEDLAYRRMLDLYYLREAPLPADAAEVARLVRLRAHLAEVETVLREFFVLTDESWVSKRCQAELVKMLDKQAKAQASAKASVNARRAKAEQAQSACTADVKPSDSDGQAGAERTLSERSMTVELPTPTPTPTPKKEASPDGDAARKRAVQRPADVPEGVWQDFQAIRKAKRAPLTDTALDGIKREADKAGLMLAEAIAYCCEAGWQGFNAGWYAERGGGRPAAVQQHRAAPIDTATRNAEAKRLLGFGLTDDEIRLTAEPNRGVLTHA